MKIFLSLLLVSILISCNKAGMDINELTGSTWEIYQYKEPTSTNPIVLQDTLVFTSHKIYEYNGISDNYSLTNSANQKILSLYGSKFGDISGRVSDDFNKYGEIIGVTFSTMGTSDNTSEYILWLRKVE
mgnify:CR=1 FL=1